jgi:hypothetical protein
VRGVASRRARAAPRIAAAVAVWRARRVAYLKPPRQLVQTLRRPRPSEGHADLAELARPGGLVVAAASARAGRLL